METIFETMLWLDTWLYIWNKPGKASSPSRGSKEQQAPPEDVRCEVG